MKKTVKPADKKVRRIVVLKERALEDVTGGTGTGVIEPPKPRPRDWGWWDSPTT
ncbi:MAG: hypothetical protein WKG01_29970 [Kofleriaceae bacterium]